MLDTVEAILAHGCNVFCNRQLIYNLPEQRFADWASCPSSAPTSTARNSKKCLALVLGADIVSTFDTPD